MRNIIVSVRTRLKIQIRRTYSQRLNARYKYNTEDTHLKMRGKVGRKMKKKQDVARQDHPLHGETDDASYGDN